MKDHGIEHDNTGLDKTCINKDKDGKLAETHASEKVLKFGEYSN
jgi:hypothetical protein